MASLAVKLELLMIFSDMRNFDCPTMSEVRDGFAAAASKSRVVDGRQLGDRERQQPDYSDLGTKA